MTPVQPPLLIDHPNGSENGADHTDDPLEGTAADLHTRTVLNFPDPAELRDKVLNIAGDVPDSMALIDYLMECVEQMEMTITHFKTQVMPEEDRINLEVIEASWHGVGMLGLRMQKLSTMDQNIAGLRSKLETAETAKDYEKVIGDAVQLKFNHAEKDRPVREIMDQASARLTELLKAAA